MLSIFKLNTFFKWMIVLLLFTRVQLIIYTKTSCLLLKLRDVIVAFLSSLFHFRFGSLQQPVAQRSHACVCGPALSTCLTIPQYDAGPLIGSQRRRVLFPGRSNIYSRFLVSFSDSLAHAKSQWPRCSRPSLTSQARTGRLASSTVRLLRVTSSSQLSFSAEAVSNWHRERRGRSTSRSKWLLDCGRQNSYKNNNIAFMFNLLLDVCCSSSALAWFKALLGPMLQ